MDHDLKGRIALVTGAARRSGRALALALGRAGADVAVHYHRSRQSAEAVAAEIGSAGRRSSVVGADLREPEAVEAAFAAVVAQLGRLDVLVNNVGPVIWKGIDSLTPEDWRASLDTTLLATLNACRAALPHMRRQRYGRIVNILDADADALDPVDLAAAYKIGKTASFVLTKSLAVSEAPFGISVNAVSPGCLEDSEKPTPLQRIPAGRYGTYEDLTNAVLFLVDDASSYVTGTNLKVSGGYLV